MNQYMDEKGLRQVVQAKSHAAALAVHNLSMFRCTRDAHLLPFCALDRSYFLLPEEPRLVDVIT